LSTTDGKKKLEIDCKNLENSEICTDEKSRDLHFLRNVNLEKIYLYDGPNIARANPDTVYYDYGQKPKTTNQIKSLLNSRLNLPRGLPW
jgi:hypothetical protein